MSPALAGGFFTMEPQWLTPIISAYGIWAGEFREGFLEKVTLSKS